MRQKRPITRQKRPANPSMPGVHACADSSFLAGLDVGACSVADADFILCHGTEVCVSGKRDLL